MSDQTSQPRKNRKDGARLPLIKDDDPCTLVVTDIGGQAYTIAISNEAIAHFLRLPGPLMVEECSDFVSAHRNEIMSAAAKSFARRGKVDGRIIVVAGDL